MVVKSELHEHGRECLNGLNALQKVLSGHFFWSFLVISLGFFSFNP
jgi:hypothetical protein